MIRRLAILIGPLLAILVAWLAPGCADLNSMPTQPAVPADDSDWTTVYAPIALDDLTAVWGMDADDMWMAGDNGTVLHWDGRRLERHDLQTTRNLRDIQGCATDDVWAVGDRFVARWDGRNWASIPLDHEYDLNAVLCEAPDQIYLGGRAWTSWRDRHAVVSRYTGQGWKDWKLPSDIAEVHKLWRPHADGALFAIVEDSVSHAYRVDDGDWYLMDWPGEILDADGDLVLLDNHDWENPASLYRLETDHTLTPVCEQFDGDRIIHSRAVIAGYQHGLMYEFECSQHPVLGATPERIYDVAVPERPGPASISIFVVGNDAMAMVGGWQRDWTVDWRTISPVDSHELTDPMLGNDTHLFVPYVAEDTRGIFVCTADGQHREPLGYIPDGLLFLESGDLLVWNRYYGNDVYGEVHVRDAAGTWEALPPTERSSTKNVWGTSTDDLVAMTGDGTFLRLIDGQWVVQDQLGGYCKWFGAVAADQIYAVIELRNYQKRLLRFDGTIWRDITPENIRSISGCYLGPHSGTLYVGFYDRDGYRPLKYRQGQWEEYPEGRQLYVNNWDMQEAADGGLYGRYNRDIRRWHPGGWKTTYSVEHSLADFFVDPVGGVHTATHDDRLLHHPYRPR